LPIFAENKIAMSFTPNFNLIEELKWRGLFQQDIPGTEDLLMKEQVRGYVGFDPTADSLHIGNFVPITLLMHLQRAGHIPIALVGGATGMVGDPSGKKSERSFLDEETIHHNLSCQKKQLEKFLDFSHPVNPAKMVNNHDWFKNMGFLEFIRDVGKHITVNYMMAKDSVKSRLETGISFTEFTYQLVQGYDFFHLYTQEGCKLQMGGSDQWGNITTGVELIRRKADGESYALTAPLVTKADGSKFGKSEGGNIWLDKEKTSPYKFYQFWLNTSDEDAARYIRLFSMLNREEIESIIAIHAEAPHLRNLQKALAKDITIRVHSQEDYDNAVEASEILFGQSTSASLRKLSENDFLSVFEGVPLTEVNEALENTGIIDLLVKVGGFLASNGEARRALQENSISVNKEKVSDAYMMKNEDLIGGKYLLLQKGKKNYFILKVVLNA
jgi:tyrosyl-tRNA synthetase